MLSFFPRGVLDEILNLIESVSEGFPSSLTNGCVIRPIGTCSAPGQNIAIWIRYFFLNIQYFGILLYHP